MKLRGDIVSVYREVHSWVGIIAGLFLFIAFYAGAISMFEPALETWLTPRTVLPEPVSLQQTSILLDKVFAAHPEVRNHYTVVVTPDPDHPARLYWPKNPDRRSHGPESIIMAALDPAGQLITQQRNPSVVAHFINVLHQQMGLPLPHEPALLIMGFITLGYAVALVSGVIVFLPALARSLFAVRLEGSTRRKWLDLHNLIGFCSLPFHIIMALTSVVFAFHDVIYSVQSEFLANNETPSAMHERRAMGQHAMGGPVSEAGSTAHSLLAPATVVEMLGRQAPGFSVRTLEYTTRSGSGRSAVTLRVIGDDPRYVMRGASSGFATVDPYTGHILWAAYLPGQQTAGFAILTSFFALHFGSYGGGTVRWGYFILGLAGAFLFYTGNRLWVSSRRRREKQSGRVIETKGTLLLARLTTGCCAGCMSGIAVVLLGALLMPKALSALQVNCFYHGIFWSNMALACLGLAGKKALFLISALLNLALAVVAVCHQGHGIGAGLCVAFIAFALAIGLAQALWRSRKSVSVRSSATKAA